MPAMSLGMKSRMLLGMSNSLDYFQHCDNNKDDGDNDVVVWWWC